ncbi:MAG: cupin domain-containing protein [Alphaproteobacteria bacterium]|jgi:quercetin dioxygenase-like cupin family protein|nr:cupin domain-containing protein [Alphaproteobacteria bacterium]
MRTTTPTPEEMERYIARFEDLPANKDRTAGKIPPEAREMMTARATRTVIATASEDTPWGNGVIAGPENFTVVIAECDAGNGPGLHSHAHATETFTCLQGQFRIEWGDKGEHSIELNKFDTIAVPPKIMRRFENTSDETGLLHVTLQGPPRDVEFAPSVGEDLRERFGEEVVNELLGLGYTFNAGIED